MTDIWFLIDTLGAGGGAERSTAAVLPHLRARGFEPRVIVLGPSRQGNEASVRAQGFEVTQLRAGHFLGRVLELRRLLRAEQPPILHTALFLSDQVGRLAAAGTGTKVISTLVSMPRTMRPRSPASPPAWKSLPFEWFDRLTAYTLVARFQAVTEGVKVAAVRARRAPLGRVDVVERGREAAAPRAANAEGRARLRESLGLGPGDELVLAVGRCEPAKDYPTLLRAISALSESRPGLVLAIAGLPGNDSARVDDVIRSDERLRGRVRVLGQRSDVPDLLDAADVYVLSSLYEGAAGALLEAMQANKAIVATAVTGLEGVLSHGRNCLTVPVAHPGEMAAAIASVLDDPALAMRLASEAGTDFERRFTIDRAADGLVGLYRSVLADRPAPGRTASR